MPGVKSISLVSSKPVRPRSYTIFKSKQSNICPWSNSSVPSVASAALAAEAESLASSDACAALEGEGDAEFDPLELPDADASEADATCAAAGDSVTAGDDGSDSSPLTESPDRATRAT